MVYAGLDKFIRLYIPLEKLSFLTIKSMNMSGRQPTEGDLSEMLMSGEFANSLKIVRPKNVNDNIYG